MWLNKCLIADFERRIAIHRRCFRCNLCPVPEQHASATRKNEHAPSDVPAGSLCRRPLQASSVCMPPISRLRTHLSTSFNRRVIFNGSLAFERSLYFFTLLQVHRRTQSTAGTLNAEQRSEDETESRLSSNLYRLRMTPEQHYTTSYIYGRF